MPISQIAFWLLRIQFNKENSPLSEQISSVTSESVFLKYEFSKAVWRSMVVYHRQVLLAWSIGCALLVSDLVIQNFK